MVNADCLVTCNLKDFKEAKTKVYSPDELVALFRILKIIWACQKDTQKSMDNIEQSSKSTNWFAAFLFYRKLRQCKSFKRKCRTIFLWMEICEKLRYHFDIGSEVQLEFNGKRYI